MPAAARRQRPAQPRPAVELSADEARRIALRAQGLIGAPDRRGGVPAMLARPRRGPARHDLGARPLARARRLRAARPGRPRAKVERRRTGAATRFEYWSHAASILPQTEWPWFAFRRRRMRARAEALARRPPAGGRRRPRAAARRGPLTTKDLGGAKASAEWWDWSEAKIAVEWLLDVGEVVCVERRGWRRVYDLAERAIPADLLREEPTDEACLTRLVAQGGRAMGVATRSDLADYHRLLLDQVDGVIEATGLVPVEVEGWDAPAWADPAALETPRPRAPPHDAAVAVRLAHLGPQADDADLRLRPPHRGLRPQAEARPRLLRDAAARGRPDRRPRRPQARGADAARAPGLGRAARDREDGGRAARGRRVGRVRRGRARPGRLRRRRRRRFARRSTGRHAAWPTRRPAPARTPATSTSRACATAREVYIDGERVADVTTHPAFRNSARSIARLYDALHDPRSATCSPPTDRHGIRTHKFFMPSYSAEDLLAAREAIAHWSRMSYGFMGRTPGLQGRRSWRRSAPIRSSTRRSPAAPRTGTASTRREALFLNHVLINPPIDRNKPVHEVEDVYVHVVARDATTGIIVSGAKMLATGSAITHATFVAQNSAVHLEEGKAEDYALVFIAPMDTPGKKLLCRTLVRGRRASRRGTTRSPAASTRTTRS